jgi:hypothetical protein
MLESRTAKAWAKARVVSVAAGRPDCCQREQAVIVPRRDNSPISLGVTLNEGVHVVLVDLFGRVCASAKRSRLLEALDQAVGTAKEVMAFVQGGPTVVSFASPGKGSDAPVSGLANSQSLEPPWRLAS